MKEQCENIYKIARKYADFTQETAAEHLGVSPRSIVDYESGKTIPPDDVVCKMIETYETSWLAYMHLKKSTLVGKKYLPELTLTDLPRSVLKLQKEVTDVTKINAAMIDVACDGEVDRDEKPIWQSVLTEVQEMISAGLAVLYAGVGYEKKKAPI